MLLPARHILVRGPNWIGDHVMARPFYRGLRDAYPHARITLLAAGAVVGVAMPGLFDDVRPLASDERRGPGARRRALALRGEGFDLAITLPASASAALLLWRARIPERVGFAEPGAGFFLTRARRWRGPRAGKHKGTLYRELGELLGGTTFPEWTGAAPAAARERLIVLAPGASLPLREWPYVLDLVPALRRRYPEYRLVAVGGPGDGKWSSLLRRLGPEAPEDLIGRTTLEELRGWCARAAVVVANDSGVAHVAAGLAAAPTVVCFGPGDPAYIAPRGGPVAIARADAVPCSPCESARCRGRYGYQACLRALPVDTVLARIGEFLL